MFIKCIVFSSIHFTNLLLSPYKKARKRTKKKSHFKHIQSCKILYLPVYIKFHIDFEIHKCEMKMKRATNKNGKKTMCVLIKFQIKYVYIRYKTNGKNIRSEPNNNIVKTVTDILVFETHILNNNNDKRQTITNRIWTINDNMFVSLYNVWQADAKTNEFWLIFVLNLFKHEIANGFVWEIRFGYVM